jgi:hypothetical protein
MDLLKKALAAVGLIPGGLLCFIGGYNALITLLDQVQFISF